MSDIQIGNRFLCAGEFIKHLWINAVWNCGNIIKFEIAFMGRLLNYRELFGFN